jgi:hypothetical protein
MVGLSSLDAGIADTADHVPLEQRAPDERGRRASTAEAITWA